MRKTLALIVLALLCAIPARAQVGNTTTILFPGAPSGTCAPLSFAINTATGGLFDCVGGVWTAVGGGGGGTPAGATNEVQINGGGGMFGAVTGLIGGNTNCDGFPGDGCALQSNINEAANGLPYLFCRTITNGAAGNYTCLDGADDGMGGIVNMSIQAWDGTSFGTLTVNSTGVVPFPNINSRLYEYPIFSGGTNCPTTTICEHAPPGGLTTYEVFKPRVGAQGALVGRLEAGVVTQGTSGDVDHAVTVNIGSGTSIGTTELCGGSVCIDGTYLINAYLDITTACGTTGTYLVDLIYTDDKGARTIPINFQGTGAVPATGIITTTSTNNFGQAAQVLRITDAMNTGINYSTTAVACGTGGPMVGKLYLSAEPVQ